MAWDNDLEKSMSHFDKYVRPVLPSLLRGEYISVEGRVEEIAKLLDQQVGIDLMLKHKDLFYGIGSRIQFGDKAWNTFTIRCERESGHRTEYEKLKAAISSGAMRPSYTIHAYVNNDKLISLGCAKTKDIVEWIDANPKITRKSQDEKGWANFYVASWYSMRQQGYPVKIFDGRRGCVV